MPSNDLRQLAAAVFDARNADDLWLLEAPVINGGEGFAARGSKEQVVGLAAHVRDAFNVKVSVYHKGRHVVTLEPQKEEGGGEMNEESRRPNDDEQQPQSERHWNYSDLGHHWLEDGSGSYHDFPCDHPEEHLGPEDR